LRTDAPQLRTVEQILRKNEQISDALERGLITTKTSEQLTQCNKVPMDLARLEMKYHELVRRHGRTVPVPHSPLIRSLVTGLDPLRPAPTDGETLRALDSEK
jgi:hypothetical protein